MQIIAIPCGPVMANSYIVRREGSPTCAVIDPADAKLIFDRLQKEGLTCTHILLTHGHFDHIMAAGAMAGSALGVLIRTSKVVTSSSPRTSTRLS